MSGSAITELKKIFVPIADSYELKSDRDLFLKARIQNGIVEILDGQESNILKSFTNADSLVYLPAGNRKIEDGEKVETHLLPQVEVC